MGADRWEEVISSSSNHATRFDIVVDGPDATWFEPEGDHA